MEAEKTAVLVLFFYTLCVFYVNERKKGMLRLAAFSVSH